MKYFILSKSIAIISVLFLLTIPNSAWAKKIIIQGDHNYPPYEYLENNTPTGFNIDIVRAVSKTMGLDIEIQLRPWDEVRNNLKEGNIDAITGMFYSLTRDNEFDFSTPYIHVNYAIFVRKNSQIKTLRDIHKKEIIVQRGDIMHDYVLKNYSSDIIVPLSDPIDALRLLASGKHDCALLPKYPGLLHIKERGLSNLKAVGPPVLTREYCIAVKEGDSVLKTTFDEGLNIIKATGQYGKIHRKWFGIKQYNSAVNSHFFVMVVLCALGVVILAVITMVWNRQLKKKVATKTKELNDSKNELVQIIEDAPVAMAIVNKQGCIEYINNCHTKIFGYLPDDIPTLTSWWELAFPDQNRKAYAKQQWEQAWSLSFKNDMPNPSQHRQVTCKNGEIRFIEFKITAIGTKGLVTFNDLTDTKKTKAELLKAQTLLSAAIEQNPVGILVASTKGYTIDIMNKAALSILGVPERAFLEGHSLRDYQKYWTEHYPDGRQKPETDHVLVQTLNGIKIDNLINRITRSDGTDKWVITFGAPLYNDDSQVHAALIFMQDITERIRAQKDFRLSETRFQQLSEATWEGIVIHQQGVPIQVNHQFLEMFGGYSESDAIGRYMLSTLFTEKSVSEIKRQIDTKGTGPYEVVGKRKDGTLFPVEIRAKEIEYQGQQMRVTALRDMTLQKQIELEKQDLQQKLNRARKMEAIGLLAGGVAHDLNNILSGISSYPELLLMDLPEDSSLRSPIETIHESGKRAAAVVSDLVTVARGVASTKTVLSLNTLINDTMSSPDFVKTQRHYPMVTIHPVLSPDLMNISGSEVHLRKTITNLIINAAESINGSGRISITTQNCYIDQPLKGYDQVNIGEYALLSVSDTGAGMSQVEIDRIFEPFYTRKIMGRSGTGLGLTVVWNTVQEHGGYIDVRSGENGTTFELYFPLNRESLTHAPQPAEPGEIKGDGQLILVVDDEPIQRDIACKMLEKLGYETASVESGSDALAFIQKQSVDLIVLDMVMPGGFSGRETYEKILTISPGQKAIIASGYAETEDVKAAQASGAGKFIKKPYSLELIGEAVQHELNRTTGA